MKTTETAALFDAEAARYDAAYDAPGRLAEIVRARAETVLRLTGAGPGELLDAGMGPGRLAARLDELGWRVWGVDASGEMVRRARKRVPAVRERLLQARLEALPFGDRAFDRVVAAGVLEHVDDLERALAELARVLRPSGCAVVSYPNYRAPYALLRRLLLYPAARLAKRAPPLRRPAPPRHSRPLGRVQIERLLEEAGLEVEALERVGPVGPRRLLGMRVLATQLVYAARRVDT